MKGDGRIARGQVLDISSLKQSQLTPEARLSRAYRNPVRYQVAFVDDQYDLFVSLLLLDVLEHRVAHRSKWVSSI